MADKPIGALPTAENIADDDNFVLEQNSTAKRLTGKTLVSFLLNRLNGRGGIKSIAKVTSAGLADLYDINYADGTSQRITITNGRGITGIDKVSTNGTVDTYAIRYNDGTSTQFNVLNGTNGKDGEDAYVWVRYASSQPSNANPSFGEVPDRWMGVYSGSDATAPKEWSSYKWYDTKGERGLSIYRVNGTNKPSYRYSFEDLDLPKGYTPKVGDLTITTDGFLATVEQVFEESKQADIASTGMSLNAGKVFTLSLFPDETDGYYSDMSYMDIAHAKATGMLVLLKYGQFYTHILAGAPTESSFLFEPLLHSVPGIHGYTVDIGDNWTAVPIDDTEPDDDGQDPAWSGYEALVYGYADDAKITLAMQSGRPVYCLYDLLYYLPLVSWDEDTHTAIFGGCYDSKIITCKAVAGEWSVETKTTGGAGVYVLGEGETLEDVPDDATVVVDPYGGADMTIEQVIAATLEVIENGTY